MRRLSILFIMTLLLAAGLAVLSGATAVSFKLLEADEYELDMLYSSEVQRLYVQIDFDIAKTNIDPAYYYGIFLNKDALFQNVTVSGEYEPHFFVNNLIPQHFVPELTQAELCSQESSARFIGVHMNDYANYPDIVHFRMWYYLSVPPMKLDEMQKLSTGLDAKMLWYPRNLNRQSTVKISLTTTPYISVLVGNSYAAKTDKLYSRINTNTYIEVPDQPSSLRLIRD